MIPQLRIIQKGGFERGARRSKVKKALYELSYAAFTDLLKEERKQAGLTQAKLAKKLRRPQSYVSKYERGDRRLDVVEFLEIARAIKFDPREFLSRLKI
jgi:ribosome-binding protein aMBF1 (putative translation factor)